MTQKLNLFFIFLILLVLLSCRKEKENNVITGKWLLTKIYQGFLPGGDQKWHSVPFANTEILEFTAAGQYKSRQHNGNSVQECTGTYQMMGDTAVRLDVSCQTAAYIIPISELTRSSLIFDYWGFEGRIRRKYVPLR